jgi:hypothetical protein
MIPFRFKMCINVHIYINIYIYLYLHIYMHINRAGRAFSKVSIAVGALQRNGNRKEGK